jgi:hypothetical protein
MLQQGERGAYDARQHGVAGPQWDGDHTQTVGNGVLVATGSALGHSPAVVGVGDPVRGDDLRHGGALFGARQLKSCGFSRRIRNCNPASRTSERQAHRQPRALAGRE